MSFTWLIFIEYLVCIKFYARSFQIYYLSNSHIYPVRHCYSTHFTDEQTKAEKEYVDLGQVTLPLYMSISSSAKWG